MGTANQGKYAERLVNDVLEGITDRRFAYERQYDARSAGGRFRARTGDYLWWMPAAHGVIEVKETEHDYRLPLAAFGEGQLARLHRRAMAGSRVIVVILHTGTGMWRIVPVSYFWACRNQPSVDLRQWPEKYETAVEAVILGALNSMEGLEECG